MVKCKGMETSRTKHDYCKVDKMYCFLEMPVFYLTVEQVLSVVQIYTASRCLKLGANDLTLN